MIFNQFFDEVSCTYTYLLSSGKGREALIIDPVIENTDQYISFVKKLDGGCQVPIGAYALIQKDSLNLKGLVASLDGEIIYESESIGPKNDAINIGEKLGAQLLNMGAKDILEKLI